MAVTEPLAKPDSTSITASSLGFKPCCMMSGEGTGRATVGSCAMYANAHSAARWPSENAASTLNSGAES